MAIQILTKKNKKKRTRVQREERAFYMFISPWIIGFLLLTLIPMLASFVLSFTNWDMFSYPDFVGLSNYKKAFSDKIFLLSIKNTFKYSFIAIPLNLFLSLFIAYILTLPICAAKIFRTIFYLPSLVPIVASSMIFMMLLAPNGYINSFFGLFGIQGPSWLLDTRYVLYSFVFLSVWSVGSSTLLIISAISGISTELYESAMIEGANRIQVFTKITIPIISPVLFFNLVMGIIGSLQTFSQVYIMTGGGPNNSSMMMVPYLFNQAFKYFRMGYASSLAWVLFAIILVFTALVFKSSSFWVYYETEAE